MVAAMAAHGHYGDGRALVFGVRRRSMPNTDLYHGPLSVGKQLGRVLRVT